MGDIVEESKTEALRYIVLHGDPKVANFFCNCSKHMLHVDVGNNNTGMINMGLSMIDF